MSQAELKHFLGPRLLAWMKAAVFNWVVILIVYLCALKADAVVAYVLAAYVVGTRLHALGILGHDAAHRLCSRNRWINDSLGRLLAFWPTAISLSGWRAFHYAHHRETVTENDPEVHGKRAATPAWNLPLTANRLAMSVAKDLVGIGVVDLFRMRKATPKDLRFSDAIDRVGIPSFVLSLVALSIAFENFWIIGIWFIGLVTTAWLGTRLRIWTEHQGTATTQRVSANSWQKFLFLPHNTWCHFEHHRHPGVSFSELPGLRMAMRDPAEVISTSSLFRSFESTGPLESGWYRLEA